VSGDFARWLANEAAATLAHDTPACPVCRDTGMVQCAETNPEDGAYEMACPDPAHDGQAAESSEAPEDGEQCIHCLRFTYDPHYDQCMNCGFQMHPEED
jgi:hypothetical protein